MKRIILILLLLLFIPSFNPSIRGQILNSASYGTLITSLNTSSTGAVTGTAFVMPLTYSLNITWAIVANGSAISATLEGSLDNVTWFTVDSITTPATGAIKTFGFSSIRFARISQVSRTGGTATTGTLVTSRGFITGSGVGNLATLNLTTGLKVADGTLGAPSISFISEPTLGFYRSGAGNAYFTGILNTTGSISAGGNVFVASGSGLIWQSRSVMASPSDGNIILRNQINTTGSQIKVDALPTIASGFGTSPAITAGSTPLAGSVDVGTGGTAFSGVINFNGTAFPSAPFCVAGNRVTSTGVRVNVVSTTQLTLSNFSSTAWVANDIVSWVCISSK